MEIDELPENDERLLKKPEIKRDEMGRFEQHGKALSKTAKTSNKIIENIPGEKRGPGRPPGSPNKVTAALKDMILQALDEAGGVAYLRQLALDNSSAFAGLIGKVLPTTLQASESDGGLATKLVFERVIVHPGGHREIEGVTPKQLPAPASHEAPASHTLPTEPSTIEYPLDNKDLDG